MIKKQQINDTKQGRAKHSGEQAETDAKDFLRKQGLNYVVQNYRVPLGEIDLIFKDGKQWVFVEVKYRSSKEHGCAAQYFTPAKRSKMTRAILCYLKEQNLNVHHTSLRIDVIAIDGETLNWLKNV